MGEKCPECGIELEYFPEKDIYLCPVCDEDIKNLTKEDSQFVYEKIRNSRHL